MLLSICEVPSGASDPAGKTASVFGYKLNDEILKYGVIKTDECGGYVELNCGAGIYPTGVIYGDIIDFDNNKSPYLVVFRTDSERGCASVDIYGYNAQKKEAELINIISKGYNLPEGVTGEIAIGYNDERRYIVYNEYTDGEKTKSDFYTIMDGTAFQYVSAPEHVSESGVLSYSNSSLHPEVDVSDYNRVLDDFFCDLKNASADSVSYADISDNVIEEEEEKIENVLRKAAKLTRFDIGEYSDIYDYNTALRTPNSDDIFYSITNLYDLGDQIYYVRFATNKSFYNYAVLRRTNSIDEDYQLLASRTDSIPLSDIELEGMKNAYTHNKLVYKKARGNILKNSSDSFDLKIFSFGKMFDMPKLINSDIRRPAALIGGGICLVMFVLLWVYMASEEE
ncbi:MAG: hypothetical protein J1G06_02325 [Oscillospiraceae bacterium]|nr:hypothetical protein [Oscillospiraceae bacterium]